MRVLSSYRQYFRFSGEVYKLAILGEVLHLTTSPKDISKIYKNKIAELKINTHIRHTLTSLRASPSAVDKYIPLQLSQDHQPPAVNGLNPNINDFTHLGSRSCQQQPPPGKELDVLQKVFMEHIHKSLS